MVHYKCMANHCLMKKNKQFPYLFHVSFGQCRIIFGVSFTFFFEFFRIAFPVCSIKWEFDFIGYVKMRRTIPLDIGLKMASAGIGRFSFWQFYGSFCLRVSLIHSVVMEKFLDAILQNCFVGKNLFFILFRYFKKMSF